MQSKALPAMPGELMADGFYLMLAACCSQGFQVVPSVKVTFFRVR